MVSKEELKLYLDTGSGIEIFENQKEASNYVAANPEFEGTPMIQTNTITFWSEEP